MTDSSSPLAEIVRLLARAEKIAVMTGAGMSAESGIPTFRGARNGLWAWFEPETLATAAAFRKDKALVWGWYRWRTALVEQTQPHAGHLAIAALEKLKPGLVVVTQNVDLHERAGSSDVVHLHGSLFSPRCLACGRPYSHEAADASSANEPTLRLTPPSCTSCGGPIRPGVVWFGEGLPELPWQRAEKALHGCDALLVVGTSGVVQPATGLPRLVKRRQKPVIDINPTPSARHASKPSIPAAGRTSGRAGCHPRLLRSVHSRSLSRCAASLAGPRFRPLPVNIGSPPRPARPRR